MKENIKLFLKKEIDIIKPSAEELSGISTLVHNFLGLINPELKKERAEIVVGGSFSKDTIIRKDKYDIDFFVRFEKDGNGKISEQLEKILSRIIKKMKSKPAIKLIRLKGSRDYFNINLSDKVFPISFEIVPIIKIKNAKEAENVTDLSPFHTIYIKKQIKKRKSLNDEIRLAKAFSYAQNCYGAESHIRGFSGYGLELLTSYYGSFLNFIKAASLWDKNQKIIIDPLKYYKKGDALDKLNSAKLESPIILIDPTQPERNATAALSKECFDGFIKICKNFLSNPSHKFFVPSVIDRKKLDEEAKKKKAHLLILEVKSNKKKDDVAGAKLKKFFLFMLRAIKNDFSVVKSEFLFNADGKKASMFFILKKVSKEIIVRGPPANMPEAVRSFKKKWPKCFVKKNITYAKRHARSLQEIILEIMKNKELKERGIEKISF